MSTTLPDPKAPAIYIETFGCQMNEADSEYIAERATAAGYAIARKPEDACVLVVNTCTVRDNAERRAYGRINQFKALKAADPAVKVIVAGCLAEQDKDVMRTLVPHVDAVFGTKELRGLGDTLEQWLPDMPDETLEQRALLAPMGGQADCVTGPYSALRAFVNVQRGCSYYCTYCIVPHVRGRFDDRPSADIVRDVRRRVAEGAREVTLVGQTVNAYREPATRADFADLLEMVAAIEGVERLTFVTSHPRDLSEKLARTLGAIPSLNPRLHLPLQSGSNPVLRRMNRKYTIEQYLEKLAMFRQYCPGWALTTDLIVAFPGESDEDFARTLEVCADGKFAQAFMFAYSPRRGTPAARWEQIPAATASARLRALMDTIDPGVRAYHEGKVGTTVRAFLTGPSRKDATKLSAKTLDNVTVAMPEGERLSAEANAAEPWLDVRVERAFTWGVTGTLLARAARFAGPSRPVASPVVDLVALV